MGQVGLATAAQGRGLGGLEIAAGQVEAFQGLTGLQQQQQAGHLLGGGQFKGSHQGFTPRSQSREGGFVGGATVAVAEHFGTGTQQVRSGLKSFLCVGLGRRAIEPKLKGAEHSLGIGRRADTEQTEMVNGQIQPKGVPEP